MCKGLVGLLVPIPTLPPLVIDNKPDVVVKYKLLSALNSNAFKVPIPSCAEFPKYPMFVPLLLKAIKPPFAFVELKIAFVEVVTLDVINSLNVALVPVIEP